jgi:co-chaperonin GroES (HSP10)
MEGMPKPHGRRVLVEVEEIKEEVQDGIIRVESRNELPSEGVVVDVGEGGDIPLSANIGEVVIFPKLGNMPIKYNDKHYVLVDDEEILAVKEL